MVEDRTQLGVISALAGAATALAALSLYKYFAGDSAPAETYGP